MDREIVRYTYNMINEELTGTIRPATGLLLE